jgi:hypothetical protein
MYALRKSNNEARGYFCAESLRFAETGLLREKIALTA